MTTMTVPERSVRQREDALRAANEVRVKRARLKRQIKARRQDPVPFLLDPPEWLLTMRAVDLLLAVPKFGEVKVHRVMAHGAVSLRKTVGGLSERQRGVLVSALGGGS